jgi:hypothetical protein
MRGRCTAHLVHLEQCLGSSAGARALSLNTSHQVSSRGQVAAEVLF